MKMILLGRLPLQRQGRTKEINKDTHLLLRCFIPREQAANRATLGAACRTLHLAFKGMNADEVYDHLMMCMVKAIRRYDPYYSNKVEPTRFSKARDSCMRLGCAAAAMIDCDVLHVSRNM